MIYTGWIIKKIWSCLLHILFRLSLLELLDDLSLRMARAGFESTASSGTGVPGGSDRDGDDE